MLHREKKHGKHESFSESQAPAQQSAEAGKKKKKRMTRKQKIGVAIGVCAAIACVVAAGAILFLSKPTLPGEDDGLDTQPNVQRLSGAYTFLICGTDEVGANTDSIMVARYDTEEQQINVVNIPRDTMVNVSWDIKKINSVYAVDGMDGLKKQIKNTLGFSPDYYVLIDLDAFKELVNTIGGVYYDVPFNMDYDDPAQGLSIHLKAGPQTLNGEQAMGIMRWRHDNTMRKGYSEGDIGRINTQQGFLKALFSQCLKSVSLSNVNEYARIFKQYAKTDISLTNMIRLATTMLSMDKDNISFDTLPNTPKEAWTRTYHQYLSYVTVNIDEALALVNEKLNPYKTEITRSDVSIVFINADGTLGVTSGALADSKATAKPSGSSSSSTKSTDEPVATVKPDTGGTTGETTGGTTSETTGGTTSETAGGTTGGTAGETTTGGTTGGTTGSATGSATGGTTSETTGGTTGGTTGEGTGETSGGTTDNGAAETEPNDGIGSGTTAG
jgi:LCP family protein required for cell wall assembly